MLYPVTFPRDTHKWVMVKNDAQSWQFTGFEKLQSTQRLSRNTGGLRRTLQSWQVVLVIIAHPNLPRTSIAARKLASNLALRYMSDWLLVFFFWFGRTTVGWEEETAEVNIFCLEYYSPFKAVKGLVLLDKMKQSKRENKISKRGETQRKYANFPVPVGVSTSD